MWEVAWLFLSIIVQDVRLHTRTQHGDTQHTHTYDINITHTYYIYYIYEPRCLSDIRITRKQTHTHTNTRNRQHKKQSHSLPSKQLLPTSERNLFAIRIWPLLPFSDTDAHGAHQYFDTFASLSLANWFGRVQNTHAHIYTYTHTHMPYWASDLFVFLSLSLELIYI